MKAIVCENCNSQDLVKQDGMYVCQSCGTKYSVEEAKKLMVEGTVKVDTTERSANLYKIARQAKAEGNVAQAAQYYNELAVLHPDDWESNFYSNYYQALNCKVGQVGYAAKTIMNRAVSTLNAVQTSYPADEAKQIVGEIVNAVANAGTNIYNTARKYQLETSTQQANQEACSWMTSNFELLMNVGHIVENNFANKDLALILYKKAFLYGIHTIGFRRTEAENAIKKIDPSFNGKEFDKVNGKGGCYVATAVYGSYDCPQVWTLRRFRDDVLADSWYGRAFIRAYYAISPTLVTWFGETEWFKNLWKPTLDRMVAKLNRNGVEDTPYMDREW